MSTRDKAASPPREEQTYISGGQSQGGKPSLTFSLVRAPSASKPAT